MVKPATSYKPKGYNNVTLMLTFEDNKCEEALEVYKKVFNTTMDKPPTKMSGKIAHSVFKLGDTQIMCNDHFGSVDPDAACKCSAYVYVEDVDATTKLCRDNGFAVKSEPEDMFWGDRAAAVVDPFGHSWMIVTSVSYPNEEEMAKGHAEMEAACK